ncbi:MAG: hypothetical protein O3B92_01485, partial [Actinobacteria bacterium]|nr:hypothetical protein [Actinomycetota bacterium]
MGHNGLVSALEISPRLATWRRWTDLPLLLIAIGSLPLLLLEVVADRLSDSDRNFLTVVNVVLFAAFAIDYLVGLAITNSRKTYARTQWVNLLIVITQFLA